MRKVTLTISKLGLAVGDIINIKLIDSIGKVTTARYAAPCPALAALGFSDDMLLRATADEAVSTIPNNDYTLDDDFVLSGDVFEVTLPENDLFATMTQYKITLPNGISFGFKVPYLPDVSQPHDLLSLLNEGCFYGIVDLQSHIVEDGFVDKMNLYFTGENPHFTPAQKTVMNLYEYYANDVISTANTIDVMKIMDTYLSTLIGEPNA